MYCKQMLDPLDDHGRGAATAIADSRQAIFALSMMKHIVQGGDDPGTRGTQWMTKRDCATKHIHLFRI